jgi:hypothetical protein
MKPVAIVVCSVLMGAAVWFADDFIAPLFLNSRIERLGKKNLPKAYSEKGGTVIYCRMKADDFRLPMPPGSHVLTPIVITGGFDTVDGTAEARFEGSHQVSPSEYESWLSGRLQVGAYVTAEPVPGGLSIKFHYFGDR